MRVAHAEYAATPAAFKHEKADCAVRALRIAAGMTYEEAHDALRYAGRLDRRATYNPTVTSAARHHGFQVADSVPGGGTGLGAPTLAQFVKGHPTGSYIVRVARHFVAVVDGTLHDWTNHKGARARVYMAWESLT